jgi:hypothetical protein
MSDELVERVRRVLTEQNTCELLHWKYGGKQYHLKTWMTVCDQCNETGFFRWYKCKACKGTGELKNVTPDYNSICTKKERKVNKFRWHGVTV